jgi:hypothetical protein
MRVGRGTWGAGPSRGTKRAPNARAGVEVHVNGGTHVPCVVHM